jgi:hypothetical protein
MKAQIQSQVFIYILVIIVVGMLLLFGYKGIAGLRQQQCKVQEVTFLTSLQDALQENKAYESSDEKELPAPCTANIACFVDTQFILGTDIIPDITDLGMPPSYYFFVKDSVNSHIKRNVFILDGKGNLNERSIFLDSVIVDQNVTCLRAVRGSFKIRFEGTGKGTKVMSW